MSYLAINTWAEEDRPREKLKTKGRQALTDAELIAILLGSGSRGESAVMLAQRLLQDVEGNLHELGKLPIEMLQKHRGMGEAKAITVLAALELGRRRQLSDLRERPSITSSRDAYNAIASMLYDLPNEEFWLLLVNRANQMFAKEKIGAGHVGAVAVDIRSIFKIAIDHNASAFIAVHNHPSGSLKPSDADVNLTKRMKECGKIMGITLLDHLIVSERGYYSFADEGFV